MEQVKNDLYQQAVNKKKIIYNYINTKNEDVYEL